MMRMLCWVQSVAFLIILNVIIYAAKLQITPGSIFGSASAFLCSSKTVAVLLHKPVGYVTTHVDSVQPPRPTVYSLLPQDEFPIEQYHACGRLDIKTSGLLMITNDGWLVSHVTNPTLSYNNSGLISSESDPFHRGEARNHKITKLYKVLCMGYLSDLQLQKLRDGIDLKGGLGMSAPANVTLLQLIGMKKTELLIEITEGKNRQIRRMLHEVGSGVIELQRIKIGTLDLKGIENPGNYRVLSHNEVRSLGFEPRILPSVPITHANRRSNNPMLKVDNQMKNNAKTLSSKKYSLRSKSNNKSLPKPQSSGKRSR